MSTAQILRNAVEPPRLGGAFAFVEPERRPAFANLIGNIWSEILARLADPISLRLTATRRSVTVLGFTRYVVDRRSGKLTLQHCTPGHEARRFRNVDFLFSADLPFRPAIGLFAELLQEWQSEVAGFASDFSDDADLVVAVQRAIRRACLASTHWLVLRHRVREALALDSETLDIARRTRSNFRHREVTDMHYNHVVENLAELRRLRKDNPNLLWLYGLAKSEGVDLKVGEGGLIEALRERVLSQFSLPPAAWRFVALGRRADFRLILEWLGPDGDSRGGWLELREWLRLRVAFAMREAIPPAVQRLILHDYYIVAKDGNSVTFRKTVLPIQTVRTILREAITRHSEGTLRVFAECELSDILVWIRESGISLDENQQKAGWRHLLRRAEEWKHDATVQSQRKELAWTSLISPHWHVRWQISPVTDVWQLHRAAQHYRNCMDNYLSDCMAGNVRMFAVDTSEGRRVGAIGIVRRGREWRLLDVRGFANVEPPVDLAAVAGLLAMRYTTLWQALHPLLAQQLPSVVVEPRRTEESASGNDGAADASEAGGEFLEDEEDGEDDGCWDEEEGEDRSCLVCGSSEWGCSHLVALVDYFDNSACAGLLYDHMAELTETLKERVRRLAEAGCSVSGLGNDVDRILAEACEDLRAPEHAADFMDEYDWSLRKAIVEMLGGHPSVIERYWEFDGGMPGCSTCGRDYWAPDPQSVLEDLKDMLFDDAAQDGREAA